MQLKVLTYNIHKGFDWNKKNYFLKDIKSLIQTSHADIVLLQEVVGQNNQYKKKGLIDEQFEYLADSVWPHYSYAKNAVFDHGHHGNLILSQYPIQSWEQKNISTNSFEQRGMLFCKIQLKEKGKSVYVVCVHLDLLNRGRHKQYQMIKKYIESLNIPVSAPLILAGDFNDWNKQASSILEDEMKMTEVHKGQHGAYAKTFPAGMPMLSLDRIYVRNMQLMHSYTLPKVEGNHFSDHLPLFCEVKIHAS
ncbi:MAG: endonuclease/exonuclease/phosphatase family protein [Bdellovibrionaceae bacterium]|nr:endonuclease/exonuclease/phosphatase family protein [Pseudobdellovibrionaceae bacterium]